MIKVSILGSTGYAGQELVKMLVRHPEAEIVGLGSQSYIKQPFSKVYPLFRGILDMECQGISDNDLIEKADIIFLALPHGMSVPLVENVLKQGKKVIDLGADFRLQSPAVYSDWYKTAGPTPAQLAEAVYGLPELKREPIKKTKLVANPGCYPTTVLLGLAPLLKKKIINTNHIIIDSKSGVSGAGRGLAVSSLYSEVNEDLKVYGLPRHRHTPEIEQELSRLGQKDIRVTFTPHLVPMTRGMLSAIYTIPVKPVTQEEIQTVYEEFYRDEAFIRIFPKGEFPHTKWVLGTNFCDIGLNLDDRTGKLTIISVIDNLIKGASGQAIQNMNIMFGLAENAGLQKIALYP